MAYYYTMVKYSKRDGFSLLELSLVLVIISLLAGGVIVGQELVRQAELRSITSAVEQTVTAARTFKLKYSGLPGDLKTAARYWGALNSNPAICKGLVNTGGTATCDGNGNGYFDDINEGGHFWLQMSNAGLITGRFDGAPSPSGIFNKTAVPSLNIRGGVQHLVYGYLLVGRPFPISDGVSDLLIELISASEAYRIDAKFDDGNAKKGVIQGLMGSYATDMCGDPSTGVYQVTLSGDNCLLEYDYRYTW